MRFGMLTELEMIQKAKAGNHSYLDLLLNKHDQFLLHHVSKSAANMEELLVLRRDCITYVRTHFEAKFDSHEHASFAMWLLESVVHKVCLENTKKSIRKKVKR